MPPSMLAGPGPTGGASPPGLGNDGVAPKMGGVVAVQAGGTGKGPMEVGGLPVRRRSTPPHDGVCAGVRERSFDGISFGRARYRDRLES